MTAGQGQTSDRDQHTRFWEKISLVAEISALCRRPMDDGATYVKVLRLIQGIVPFDAGMLYLRDSDSGRMEPVACVGDKVELPSFLIGSASGFKSQPQRVHRKPVLLARTDDDFDFDPDCVFDVVMTVPLLVDNEVIGMLSLGSGCPGILEEKHVKLMSVVADQIAISIERNDYVAMVETKNAALKVAHENLKAAQDKIIEAEKLSVVVELAASINHEINNPLSVIVGHIQILMMEMKDASEKMRTRLDRIDDAAMRIGEVNRKLLRFDSTVSEAYLGDSTDDRMLNLDKSTQR